MTNSPLPDRLPRYAIFRGKRARLIGYENGKFDIIDHADNKRRVLRTQLKFIKEKSNDRQD